MDNFESPSEDFNTLSLSHAMSCIIGSLDEVWDPSYQVSADINSYHSDIQPILGSCK